MCADCLLIQVHYHLHSCTLKFLLDLYSNSSVSDGEKFKIEQEVIETLKQSLLPPLGTAMYDGVWEWVYQLVTEAKLLTSEQTFEGFSKVKEAKLQFSTPEVTNEEHMNVKSMIEAPNMDIISCSEMAALDSEQLKPKHHSAKETPQEQETIDEPVGQTGSMSARSSEPDSPLQHDDIHCQLLQQCLYGVAVCAVRCPTYFKPLYRLSSAFFSLGLPKVNVASSYTYKPI